MVQPPLSRRARYMHLGRYHPRRDLSPAHTFTLATDLYPLRGTATPYRCDRAGGFHVGLIFYNFSIKFSLKYSNGQEK